MNWTQSYDWETTNMVGMFFPLFFGRQPHLHDVKKLDVCWYSSFRFIWLQITHDKVINITIYGLDYSSFIIAV